jgi:threonine aldolase
VIDLRSDTVTRPTAAMRRAMAEAEVGDDLYGEDPTVNRLQERAARLLGFEAALFVPSGTMANEIAIRLLARPCQIVLAEERSHVIEYELGGMAALSGAVPRPLRAESGMLTPEILRAAVRAPTINRSEVALAILENTHNLAGGVVSDVATMRASIACCRELGLKVHVDGARLWNAAAALGVEPSALVAGADTVMVSLSKGLCCPVGSLLAGSRELIEAARRVRQLFGGGWRQAGVLAAAGLLALDTMRARLGEDHQNARILAAALQARPQVRVTPPQTYIVVATLGGRTAPDLAAALRARGVLASALDAATLRLVTHHDVSRADCETAARALREAQA